MEPIHTAHPEEASIAVPADGNTCDSEESNAGQGGPVRALEAEADGGEEEEHEVQRDLSARTFLIAAHTPETYADYLGELLLLGAERAAERRHDGAGEEQPRVRGSAEREGRVLRALPSL